MEISEVHTQDNIHYEIVFDSQLIYSTYVKVMIESLDGVKSKEIVIDKVLPYEYEDYYGHNSLVDGNFDASMIKTIAEIFLHETETNAEDTILDLSLKSTVLNYVISGVFLGFADEEDAQIKIIVPSNLCNVDSEEIVTIKKEELETLFTSLIGALDILKEESWRVS